MASDPLSTLSSQISTQYGGAQGNIYSVAASGNAPNYSQPGDYSNYFSKAIQRNYLEEGYLRLDPFNVVPKSFETLIQEPDAVILVKKRAFSSLSEAYRPDFMDAEEKLYLKATKILFQNKCAQISAIEKLTKIARVSSAVGQIDDQLMPLIINLIDSSTGNFAAYDTNSSPTASIPTFGGANVGGGDATAFQRLVAVINQVRKIFAYSPPNLYTTWIANLANPFQSTLGQGTGVLEFTSVTDIQTNTTVDFNSGGTFSLSIADPYGFMRVTESDIDYALSDALNFVANSVLFQQGQLSLQDISAQNISNLNQERQQRGASAIQIIPNSNVINGNLVTAIFGSTGIQINFNYNPSAGLLPSSSSAAVTVGADSLQGSPTVGTDGLSPAELSLFQTAIISIFQSISYTQQAQSTVFTNSVGKSTLDLNYVRNKLRFHYGNKMCVQPMDRVQIYIGSKSRTDDQAFANMSDAFSGYGFLSNMNNLSYSIADQVSSLFNPSGNIDLQLEKSYFVGSNFPNGLWSLMRNTFVSDKSGCSVFGGLIDSSRQTGVPGKFTVSISGKDNTHFFDFGVINLNPGVDNFAGPLYDPLTPYKTRFDVISTNYKDQNPEFLDENKLLLNSQTFSKGMIKYTSGRYAGMPVTQNNFIQDTQITKDGKMRSVIHGPAGLVYKWKEGIGTFTYNADSYSATDPERIGIPALTNDPFAGQDIMNTLSLLICGVPYNYQTYYKAVSEFDNTARDPQTGQDPAVSFYNALQTTLQKNDLLWGGFVPFKNLVVDEASYQAANAKQLTINDQNNVITNQLNQIQNLKNQLYLQQAAGSISSGSSNAVSQAAANNLSTSLSELNTQLSASIGKLQQTIPTMTPGADTSFSPSNTSSGNTLSNPTIREETRRLTNFLTRRFSWQVRANEDKNLLIIDDSYDKDYDILAYVKDLQGSISQFNSEYNKVRDKISTVASLLNLEVFCDTQGHIRIRPQQYNKMPSSVFARMMQLKYLNGIQVFPKFLSDLYVDQINSLIQSLEVLELELRLDGAYIGIADDGTLANFIGNGFVFFSNSQGDITDVSKILANNNPDQIISNIPQNFIVQVQGQSKISTLSPATRAAKAQTILSAPGITTVQNVNLINQLISYITIKSGGQVTLDNFLVSNPQGGISIPSASIVDVVKVTSDIESKVNQRQQLMKTLSSTLTNAQEFKEFNSNPNQIGNQLMSPQTFNNQQIPAVFQHMIENEIFDDYGPGSGARYVIHNYQILSMELSEVPPDVTAIEVQGLLDPFITNNNLPFGDSGKAFPNGGNPMITAAAIDYDLWRMYGFKTTSSVPAPFLSQPESQCAPYAVSLLTRARKDILQATITIAGNEYMQPGEVVYVEEWGLLFYVQSVSHQFQYGGRFTTSLTLKYGHNPGEYIPTPLDIIGKVLYSNRDIAGYVNYRQTSVFNENDIGAIIIQIAASEDDPFTLLTGGNEGSNNISVINNLLYGAAGVVATNSAAGSNVSVSVELRIFYDSSAGSINSNLSSVRDTLKGALTGTVQIPNNNLTNAANKIHLPASVIVEADIDISNKSETRSPSKRACDQARNLINASPGLGSTSNPLFAAMSQGIIDCVLVFNPATTSAGTSTTSGASNG
jgi:hypothetical protein